MALGTVVDLAGVAGFLLSLTIAIAGIYKGRLRLKLVKTELLSASHHNGVFFLLFTLSNQTSTPVTILSADIRQGEQSAKAIDTVFSSEINRSDFDSGLITITSSFPLEIGGYAAAEICVPFDHPEIKEILRAQALESDDPSEPPPPAALHQMQHLLSHIACGCFHKSVFQLALLQIRTTRGTRAYPLRVESVGDQPEIRAYVVRKSLHKGSAKFL